MERFLIYLYASTVDWTCNFLGMPEYPLGILDIVSIVLIIIGTLTATCVGFLKTAGRQAAWVLSFPLALVFTSLLASLIAGGSTMGIFWATMLSFMILSVGLFFLMNLLASLLNKIFMGGALASVNHILGFVWGAIASSIMVVIIYAIIILIPGVFFKPLLESSALYRAFSPSFREASNLVKGAVSGTL